MCAGAKMMDACHPRERANVLSRIGALQERNEKLPQIWKAEACNDQQGNGGDGRGVKRAPGALVIEHLKHKMIAAQRQPELEKKAAHFRFGQIRERRFRIRPVPFTSRRDNLPAE